MSTTVTDRIECRWCHAQSPATDVQCRVCGAPLNKGERVADSGWAEAPRLRDMTEIHFGNSVCQVEGEVVPVAEMNLSQGDGVFFEHHTMLWKDPSTAVGAMPTGGGVKRLLGGMPFSMTVAQGPGRVAFSRDAPGEVVVIPLHPSMELDVRGHAFLVASHTIQYSFVRLKGFVNVMHGGELFMDRFVTTDQPGILLLHGFGNVFQRTLAAGEQIMVEPGGFLYKDSSVTMEVRQQNVKTGMMSHGLYLAEMTGPGRVGIQSMYYHHPAGE